MRLALIQIGQETNTFNPRPTTLRDFAAHGLYEGSDILEKLNGIGTVGGYLAAIEHSGLDIETVPVARGWAVAGGRMSEDTRLYFEDRVRQGLLAAGPVDGLAIHLHGACASEQTDDVEGSILAICREALGPRVPIVLTLDHHANITQRMVAVCDAIVGYRTQPHDPLETAEASTRLLLRVVAGEAQPVMAWRKLRLIAHQEQYLTSSGPMKVWFDRARALENDRHVLSISNFPMQPWLDVEEGGWSTVVVTDGDAALAERIADELAELAWSMRAEFQRKTSIPADEAVSTAEAAPEGVVLLSDTGDSVFGGGAGDSTILLDSLLRKGNGMRALVPIVDPAGAATLARAGEGASVRLAIGGTLSSFFEPLEIAGTVRKLANGHIEVSHNAQREVDMGQTVVLDVGPVTVLLSELQGLGGNHPGVYRAFDVEPREYKAAVLKTASNFQYFAPISPATVRVDTAGPTQSDIVELPWKRLPRPIYPLDPIETWRS